MSIRRRRWLTKKLARHGVALGMMGSGALAAKARLDRAPVVRALMYHRFGDAIRDPWCVDTATFDKQMRWVAERGLAVSLEQLIAFVEGRGSVPKDAVLVTTDDGYRSVLTHMAPVLQCYGIPAVAYVTTSLLGSEDADRTKPEPYLSWDEAARLPAFGVTLGSHAHTHSSLGQMSLEQVRSEGARSRELLRSRLGVKAESFADPYGMGPEHSQDTRRVLGEVGYSSIFVAMHGAIRQGADPLNLPRIKIEGGEGLPMFKLLCRGALDVWRVFDEPGRLQRAVRRHTRSPRPISSEA